MFDIDGPKLLLLAVVALVAIGPKELPSAIRTGMSWMRKTRALAREFQSGIEELSREAGVNEIRREVEESARAEELEAMARGLEKDLDETIDPETRKILEDPETQKLLSEIESGEFYGSPPEALPAAQTAVAETEALPPKPVEAPPGATGS